MSVCALTKASGITSIESWMTAKAPVKLGGTGSGATTDDVPRILAATLGLPIHVVRGYKGTAEIRLAAESGEIGGGCWHWESVKSTSRQGLDSGDVAVLLQVSTKPLPDLPKVATAMTLAKTDEARQLITAGILIPTEIGRIYLRLGAQERWLMCAVLTVAAAAFVYGLFGRALRVPFPAGRLFAWLGVG